MMTVVLGMTASGSLLANEDDDEDRGPRKCIPTRKLTSTAVIDERNILFIMIGKTIYHNILPKQCRGLGRQGFTYGNLAGSLCNLDTIQIIQSPHGTLGRLCRLGDFHPVTNEELPALVNGILKPPTSSPLPSADVEEVSGENDEDPAPE